METCSKRIKNKKEEWTCVLAKGHKGKHSPFVLPVCWKCLAQITDAEYNANEDGTFSHLNACPAKHPTKKQKRIAYLETIIATSLISVDNGAEAVHDADGIAADRMMTCGTCKMTWNDALITSRTPVPSGRCPYEDIHGEIAELRELKRPRQRTPSPRVRLNAEEKAEFYLLYIEAVKLQVQLYDKLGEIEGITGYVNGLDDAVREEASNWSEPDMVKLTLRDISAVLAGLERES